MAAWQPQPVFYLAGVVLLVMILQATQLGKDFAFSLDVAITNPNPANHDIDRPKPRLTKYPALHFIHIPKCGTSFLTTLRNYLDACTTKRYTCPGGMGGFRVDTLPNGTTVEVPAFDGNYTVEEGNCNGALSSCSSYVFHGSWGYWKGKFPDGGVTTMLRTPLTRLVSHYFFARRREGNAGKDIRADAKVFSTLVEGCAENPGQNNSQCFYWLMPGSMAETTIKMLAGINQAKRREVTDEDYQLARHRLFKEVAFFGITEMWTESVCTFHCELGGVTDPSELLNSRDNGKLGSKRGDEELLSPKAKAFMDKVMARENEIYADAKRVFLERAGRCGCL
jgi:hypothetical protein